MTQIVYDNTSQTYVAVELPHHIVQKHIKEFKNLDDYHRHDTLMDFSQYLIWEDQCNINPNLVTEIAATEIPEVEAQE